MTAVRNVGVVSANGRPQKAAMLVAQRIVGDIIARVIRWDRL
jgi:hypothetical protein